MRTDRRRPCLELVVAEFENDSYRASDVLHELRLRDCDWVVDLEDAVAVYRNYDGILHVEYSDGVSAGEGSAWGGSWGPSSAPSWPPCS